MAETFEDVDAQAEAHIAQIEQQTTAALALVEDYMPTIEEIASLLAPYYMVDNAEYAATQFDLSGVVVPSFTELNKTDSALQNAASQQLEGLSAGSNSLYPEMKVTVDTANAEFEAIWNAIAGVESSELVFKEDDFIAEIINGLQAKLVSALGDAPGSSTASESKYYTNDAVRRNAARIKEQDDTMNEFASRGWSLPDDVLDDLRSTILRRQGMSEADRARVVIIQQSTLSEDNKTRAIDAGLRYNQILVTYFEHKMQRAFQMATAGLKVMQELAEMKFYVLRERMGVQKEYFDLISENQRLIFDEFDQNAKAFAARMDKLISVAGSYLDAYTTEGHVFSIRKGALNDNRKFVLSEGEIIMDTMRWNLANALKAFADNSKAFEATAGIRLNAAKAGAEVQIGIAQAARNSVSTIVGILTNKKTTEAKKAPQS